MTDSNSSISSSTASSVVVADQDMANVSPRSITSGDERALHKRGYILGGKVGQGSYAKVRSCTYVVDGRSEVLACKIIDRSKAPTDFLRKFFPRELDIITWLDHPHVIRVHSILERQDRVFIFMQYCENGDLLDYVRDHGVVKEAQARVWFKQMYSGLAYLHSRNIAHRDLKCENILLTRHWNVKLGDFGFARAVVDQDGRRVLSETYCGSAAYAAPEVVRGNPYNPKMSDLWSVGIILFIMVNAAMPFDDSNLKKMLKDQQSRNWHLRSKVKDKLTNEIKDMLQKILEPDVTKRITVERIGKHPWITKPIPLLSPPARKTPPASGRQSRQRYKTLHRGDEASPSHRSKVQSNEPSLKDGESFFDVTIGNTERRYEENQRRRLLEQKREEREEREERHRRRLLELSPDAADRHRSDKVDGDRGGIASLRRGRRPMPLRVEIDSVIERFRSSDIDIACDDLVLEEDEMDEDDDFSSEDSDDLLDPLKVGREFESMMSTS